MARAYSRTDRRIQRTLLYTTCWGAGGEEVKRARCFVVFTGIKDGDLSKDGTNAIGATNGVASHTQTRVEYGLHVHDY
jgi:hypothetical protein